ncbi:FliM/FliN family flagellar motor switch protein [Labrenzia sp. OB1]|uniref:FliM/FliN family flagellar motor switch protein n=1 Tax=Labrenzia sp. OB1 TaxID=1561204 RepID=UPI0007B1CA80|nr:FliM/FliN family flagellar motor switch protein [Labrenzia sp. OB1]KZM47395.1 hypothetical protein OA90_26165 [Labrenzia sp. OB1]
MTFMHWSAPEFRIERDKIALWNAALSFSDKALPIGSGETNLIFSALEKLDPFPAMRSVLFDDKECGFVGVQRFPFEAYCGVLLDIEDLEDAPVELADALQEGMLSAVLSALPRDFSARLKLGGKPKSSDLVGQTISADLQWFSCKLTGICDEPIIFSFGANRNDICAQLAENTPTARRVHSALGQSITTCVTRLVGSARLAAAELYELEAGDCVLISDASAPSKRAILSEDIVFLFEQTEDADKWLCVQATPRSAFTGTASIEEFAMEDSQEAVPEEEIQQEAALEEEIQQEAALEEEIQQEAALEEEIQQEAALEEEIQQEAALAEGNEPTDALVADALASPAIGLEIKEEVLNVATPLEVTVDFTLGATRLPLDEIASWQPGTIVMLPAELSEDRTLVTVDANGSPIAQGDLVQIDNRLAVRLNRILLSAVDRKA